jgi:hypothetical protein
MTTNNFSVSERMEEIRANITTIQDNYEQVTNTSFSGNYPSIISMNEGLTMIKQGFSTWPATKNDLENAIQLALNLKDQLDTLESSTMDETIIPKLNTFKSGPLSTTQSAWDTAAAHFAVFSDQLIQADVDSRAKISQAQTAFNNDENKFQSDLQNLKNEIDDFNSAGSIAIGVFTVGIYTGIKYGELKDDYNNVLDEQHQVQEEYYQYAQALSSFTSANTCASAAVYKMTTFQASVQQVQNQLNDLPNIDSSNMIVIKALLQAIKSDYN